MSQGVGARWAVVDGRCRDGGRVVGGGCRVGGGRRQDGGLFVGSG